MRTYGRKLTSEAAAGHIRSLISSAPTDITESRTRPETQMWLGRVKAVLGDTIGAGAELTFNINRDKLGSDIWGPEAFVNIMGLLYEASAAVELDLPARSQGAFIPAGNRFDALAAVTKIFDSAERDLFIIDPYLDEKFLIEYAQLANEGVGLRLLRDADKLKTTLKPSVSKWMAQNGERRPMTLRLAPARTLHDRLIFVDGEQVWSLGQSFNHLAARAHTSFGRVDPETAALKIAAYEEIWLAAEDLDAA